MYVLRKVDNREIPNASGNPVVGAFNIKHAARRVDVDWGIAGFKNKFRRMLKICPNRRSRFASLFESCCMLTNFRHRIRLDVFIAEHGFIKEENINNDSKPLG
jgi:hypothetical protein